MIMGNNYNIKLRFNVIRLNVAFEGAMKTRGIVDDQYIIKIREIV